MFCRAAYFVAIGLLCFLHEIVGGIRVYNDTRKPVAVAFVRTIFTLGDLHNKLYVAPGENKDDVMSSIAMHVIPPGHSIVAPDIGGRSFLTYNLDLWASYSPDDLAQSLKGEQGRRPYRKTVVYYTIGNSNRPLHILEHKSQLSFIIQSRSNEAKLEELGEVVRNPYKNAEQFDRLMRLFALPYRA